MIDLSKGDKYTKKIRDARIDEIYKALRNSNVKRLKREQQSFWSKDYDY